MGKGSVEEEAGGTRRTEETKWVDSAGRGKAGKSSEAMEWLDGSQG